MEVQKLLTSAGVGKSKPRKIHILKFYQKLHYKDRIKPTFEKEWAQEQQQHTERVARGEEIPNEGGAMCTLRDRVVERLWNLETKEFRDEVQQEANKDFEERTKEAQMERMDPETPEEYHKYVMIPPIDVLP